MNRQEYMEIWSRTSRTTADVRWIMGELRSIMHAGLTRQREAAEVCALLHLLSGLERESAIARSYVFGQPGLDLPEVVRMMACAQNNAESACREVERYAHVAHRRAVTGMSLTLGARPNIVARFCNAILTRRNDQNISVLMTTDEVGALDIAMTLQNIEPDDDRFRLVRDGAAAALARERSMGEDATHPLADMLAARSRAGEPRELIASEGTIEVLRYINFDTPLLADEVPPAMGQHASGRVRLSGDALEGFSATHLFSGLTRVGLTPTGIVSAVPRTPVRPTVERDDHEDT